MRPHKIESPLAIRLDVARGHAVDLLLKDHAGEHGHHHRRGHRCRCVGRRSITTACSRGWPRPPVLLRNVQKARVIQRHVGLEAGHLRHIRRLARRATGRDHGRVAMVGVHPERRLVVGAPEPEGDEPGVQQAGVVRVLDVLLHQLPVARNALAVVAQDGELAAIEQPVKVAQDGGAQKLLQRLHAVVKRRKHHAATGSHLELGQPMLCRVEVRWHAAIDLAILLHATPKRHTLQVARQGVVPLVVRAGQALAVAMPLAAKRHAPVGADVFHHMDRSILVTHQQH